MNFQEFDAALEQMFVLNESPLQLQENQRKQLFEAMNIILEKTRL